MAKSSRKRRLSPEQRRALELLAGDRHGINEDLLVYAHGFSRRMLAGLVRSGLTAEGLDMMMAGDRAVAVVRVRITTAGRKAIEG
jgi:hypothetical protein